MDDLMMKMLPSGRIMKVLSHLVVHGWISLRGMSCLLGYSHPTGIYGRQRSKRAIPITKIGGQYRVYTQDVLDALTRAPEQDQGAMHEILYMYENLVKKQRNKWEQENV